MTAIATSISKADQALQNLTLMGKPLFPKCKAVFVTMVSRKYGITLQTEAVSPHLNGTSQETVRVGLPIRQRQTLQDFTLAGDSTELAALVHSGHAKATVALHAAPYQQPVPWLKDVQLHFLPCI